MYTYAMDKVEAIVVGAGAVGLAIARAISSTLNDVVIIDQHSQFGSETSSRNSEVIHAGIYYPNNTLKAETCVRGKHLLYDYCQQFNIPHRAIGKLIIAFNPAEVQQLETLHQQALQNGVTDLQWLDAKQLKKYEPDLNGHAALFSPSTGILDSHTYMQTLLTHAQQRGTMFIGQTRFLHASFQVNHWVVKFQNPDGSIGEIASQWLINSAGLGAQACAQQIDGITPSLIPPLYLCRGHYFTYSGRNPFKHLIYPVPEKNQTGLGIHSTQDLAGQLRFGPDSQYIEDLDYEVNSALKADFIDAIKRYWPKLDEDKLHAGYSGIRPKLQAPGDSSKDFIIQSSREHGLPNLVQLFGIESPGLTASLALAERVHALIASK
ncbi:NAD(P)/FAD-dependent oxidoreductase [Bermanella marisrubri]|nr:NAD(P)/FAD-dependent oxidoreductase [Bermanella marisrubri]